MKKIISIVAVGVLAVSAFATGNVGVNTPQSGVITIANAATSYTNTFAYPFQNTPLLVVYSSLTNGAPITNNSVTTTNFVISYPAAGTNAAYAWQAFVGGTRMETGTQVMSTTTTNVTFPNAYASAPVVTLTGSATTNTPAASSITTTNFTITIVGSGTIQWSAVGTVYNPQTEYTGPNPIFNKVLY